MILNKRDFYYGGLIAKLVESGFAPAILEKELDDGRMYSIINDFGNYTLYTKYVSSGQHNTKRETRWNFLFSSNEITYLKENASDQLLIALICGDKDLRGTRIAFLTYHQFKDSIGRGFKTVNRTITIKHTKNNWNYMVYGTGLDGDKNYIKLTGNIRSRLDEIKNLNKEVLIEN